MRTEKPSARMLSTSRGLMMAAVVAIGVGLCGFAGSVLGCEAEASPSELRVVRASVTWREGARELSVVHVAEPVREAAPRVVVTRDERRPRFGDDPSLVGRDIRAGVAAMMMVVRLLASGKMDG